MKKLIFSFLVLSFFACEKDAVDVGQENPTHDEHGNVCTDSSYCGVLNTRIGDKLIQQDGETWLWGGENEDWHFNISNLSLDISLPDQYSF